ncbi:MAG: tetratricopeptide repeat protein [Candidatus Azobacteroides sp.]|nr:tetratricopeptide repeat protein [Candidatus Azobacteroides sp.]
MRRKVLLFLSLLSVLNFYAQHSLEEEIKDLFENEEYKTIIEQFASKNTDYSAKSLYYIGTSYMLLEDDINCIEYTNLSIAKDSIDPAPYYTQATSYLYINQFENAIPLYRKAIMLETDKGRIASSYRGLGISYYNLNEYDPALKAYYKAIEYDIFVPHPYLMIARIYSITGQEDKALETYYMAKENTTLYQETADYATILFNIGLYEQLNENYTEAEIAFRDLIDTHPDDFHAYSKLIQIYYHNKEYEKAVPLKEILYQAHKDKLLEGHLADRFCMDQFKWKDKSVQVFERYEEGDKARIYNKLLFFILDKDNNPEYSIQTEYSPIAVEMGEATYILCANKNEKHINYGIGFNKDTPYKNIKNAVISILEKE